MDITKITHAMKSWGLVISLPVVIVAGLYFFDKEISVQKGKTSILEKEIEFLKEKNLSISYSAVWTELNAQKNIYETKLQNINTELKLIKTELERANITIKEISKLLEEQSILHQEKEKLLHTLEDLFEKQYMLIGKLKTQKSELKIENIKLFKLQKQLSTANMDIKKLKRSNAILQNSISDINTETTYNIDVKNSFVEVQDGEFNIGLYKCSKSATTSINVYCLISVKNLGNERMFSLETYTSIYDDFGSKYRVSLINVEGGRMHLYPNDILSRNLDKNQIITFLLGFTNVNSEATNFQLLISLQDSKLYFRDIKLIP